MSDDRKDLPPAKSANFLEKAREALQVYLGTRGDVLDKGVTLRDLVDAGMVTLRRGLGTSGGTRNPISGPGELLEPAYETDLTPPPTPSGFTATAAISNLMVECGSPTYPQGHGHAKSKLYGATWISGALPVFADAVVITEFNGTVASYATNPATTWRLWLTWVTRDGVESTVPAGGTNGVAVTTGQDVSTLLTALSGEITEGQLYTALNTRIDLIDASAAVDGSVAFRVAAEALIRSQDDIAEADARVAAIAQEVIDRNAAVAVVAGTVVDEAQARIEAVQAEADARVRDIFNEQRIRADQVNLNAQTLLTQTLALHTETEEREEAIAVARQEIRTDIVDGLSAEASARLALATQVDINASAIVSEQITRSNADSAMASDITTLYSESAANTAAIQTESTTRTDADSALSLSISTLTTTVNGNTAAIAAEQTARADGDTAVAATVTSLSAQVNHVTTGLPAAHSLIATEQTARADGDAAEAAARVILAARVTTAEGDITTNAGAIVTEQGVRADADGVLTTNLNALTATVTGVDGVLDTQAAIIAEQEVQATLTDAIARDNRTLVTQSRELDEVVLTNLLTSESARSDFIGTVALAREDLTSRIIVGELAEAEARLTLAAIVDANAAALTTEQLTRTTADSALASDATVLTARVTVTEGDILANVASITSEQTARANADTALASRATALEAAVIDIDGELLTKATISYVDQAEADAISSAASTTALVQAQLDTGGTTQLAIAAAQTQANTATTNAATAQTTANTAVSASSANASTISDVQARLDSGDFAAVQVQAAASASSVTGLLAQYTVKLDVGGKVSGYGLASSETSSEFAIRADRFYIAPPATGAGTATQIIPFAVQAVDATLPSGVVVPAGVYMDGAYVKNLNADRIVAGTIDADIINVTNVTAVDIEAGSIMTGDITSTGTTVVEGVTYPSFSINASTGLATFNNAVVRGTVYATAGLIGGITVADSAVRAGQTAYNLGSGFYLGADGRLSLGNSTGNRLTWDGTSLAITGALTATTIATNSGKFAVSSDGILTATEASISGAITASTITGSTINSTSSLNGVTGTFSGTLTADAVNAVSTINIAGNAVTFPVGTQVVSTITVGFSFSYQTMISLTMNTGGAPVFISCMIKHGTNNNGRINVFGAFLGETMVASVSQEIASTGLVFLTGYAATSPTGDFQLTIRGASGGGGNQMYIFEGTTVFAIGAKR